MAQFTYLYFIWFLFIFRIGIFPLQKAMIADQRIDIRQNKIYVRVLDALKVCDA
jgi:hypothetical protein